MLRRIVETLAELPFIGDQVVCLSHDQGARSGPAERGARGLAAEALAKKVGDIRLVIYDHDACATSRLSQGQVDGHDAASAIVVW